MVTTSSHSLRHLIYSFILFNDNINIGAASRGHSPQRSSVLFTQHKPHCVRALFTTLIQTNLINRNALHKRTTSSKQPSQLSYKRQPAKPVPALRKSTCCYRGVPHSKKCMTVFQPLNYCKKSAKFTFFISSPSGTTKR